MDNWEKVAKNTERLKVPGGWLYQVGSTGVSVRLCFVPDCEKDFEWPLHRERDIV